MNIESFLTTMTTTATARIWIIELIINFVAMPIGKCN